MNRTTKIQVYVIFSALILALIIIVLFWALNYGKTTKYTLNQTTSTGITIQAGSETITSPNKKNMTAAPVTPGIHKGLTKLMETASVSALIIGDSIAESQGASNKDLSSWHALVDNDLHDRYPGTIQWHFKTSAGASINDALKFTPSATQDTDLIILCLGRQDSGRMKLSEFKQKYEQLLVKLKAQSPNADLFLVVEPPVKSNVENNKFFPYRKIILDLAQKHQLPVIDEWTAFINDPVPLTSLLADNGNPNDKGYRVFADGVLKGFEGYLMPAY
ncbi:SGNH/GDSL hydrolase family protein [Desulfosporosinus sp. Sb-LF]|uniref:SGNH/GDSL hydrolase family protein n=1 Tax=Desulfosporosinus sp. Sb-LF TaxID=2560027 RepID=UPI00107F5D5B|nr:SGNH/GDSL hydrolase family protein [Desulfosporosinus sp. Sb-LF]TGE31915.1 SGNH/GDSL hydrolase family protein [Desulfosporosinus sp. Sb-LF]